MGSITNGTHKIEIRIPNFDAEKVQHLHKGHQIKLNGNLFRKSQITYINVNDVSNIYIISNERKFFQFILAGFNYCS